MEVFFIYSLKLVSIIIVLFILFGGMCASYAEHGIGAHNIKITKKYVKADGVCSCSLCQDRNHHTRIYVNYCPYCKKYGILNFEQASYWQEGLWYCTHCDADFCLTHGKEHTDPTKLYLTPYNGVINDYIIHGGCFTREKIQNNTTPIFEEYIEIPISHGQKYKIKKETIQKIKTPYISIQD